MSIAIVKYGQQHVLIEVRIYKFIAVVVQYMLIHVVQGEVPCLTKCRYYWT